MVQSLKVKFLAPAVYYKVNCFFFFFKEALNNDTFVDTYPDISNYRNILSIGGSTKPRPTLFELQVRELFFNQVFLKHIFFFFFKNLDNFSLTNYNSSKIDPAQIDIPMLADKALVVENDKNLEVVKFGWIQGVLVS